jgi:hypothetical protein
MKQGTWKEVEWSRQYDIGQYSNNKKEGEWKRYTDNNYSSSDFYNNGRWYKEVDLFRDSLFISKTLNITKDTLIEYDYNTFRRIERENFYTGINDSTYRLNLPISREATDGLKLIKKVEYNYQPFSQIEWGKIIGICIYLHDTLQNTSYYDMEQDKKTFIAKIDSRGKVISGNKKKMMELWQEDGQHLSKELNSK